MHTEAMSACQQLYGFTNQSLTDPAFQIFYDLGGFLFEQLKDYIKSLSLADLNYILYRCHEEEDVSSSGAYEVPGCGRLVYCGLQGNLIVSQCDCYYHLNLLFRNTLHIRSGTRF